jgi:CBS domain-containing protein
MALTVRHIMDSDPVSVTVADSVETVLHVMRDHDLRGVPVVNEGGRCVGIITEADLVLSFEERARKAYASTAEDMMTPDPVTIEPDASVREAARVIARKKHNRLPVIEHGRLVGVVTRVDVLDGLAGDEE